MLGSNIVLKLISPVLLVLSDAGRRIFQIAYTTCVRFYWTVVV